MESVDQSIRGGGPHGAGFVGLDGTGMIDDRREGRPGPFDDRLGRETRRIAVEGVTEQLFVGELLGAYPISKLVDVYGRRPVSLRTYIYSKDYLHCVERNTLPRTDRVGL